MVIVFASGALILYVAAASYARFAADRSFDRLLAGSAGSIAETLSITTEAVRADIPYAALDMLAAAPNDRVFYRVVGADGVTVTGYADLPDHEMDLGQLSNSEPIRFFDAAYRGELVRFVVLGRTVRTGTGTGLVQVQVGQTREARRDMARELTIRAVLPILLLTVAAAAVVWINVGIAVRPLEDIGRSLVMRSSSDLSQIEADVPDEIAPLVSAVNQFMARLDNNMSVLRNFIATAAHQLRTPLTALLVQIRSAEIAEGSGRIERIGAASQSAKRLARLVDQLLSDAMVTHRAEIRRVTRFDLKKVIEQALRETLMSSRESDVRFTTSLDSACLSGDQVMVAEAIKNLIHNALTHGETSDGVIEITLREQKTHFELVVADAGPGISDEMLSQVGERFGSSRGGMGLGLAIVKQVVESHKGSLRLVNRPEGGLEVTLRLPRQ